MASKAPREIQVPDGAPPSPVRMCLLFPLSATDPAP